MDQESGSGRGGKTGSTARIIHLAIASGLVVLFVVFMALQGQGAIEMTQGTARALRLAGYLYLGGAVLGAQLVRGRISAPGRAEDLEGWWSANLPKALIVWGIAEGGGLGALVLGWILGDTTLLALGAAVALALLFVNRPGRLSQD